MENKPFIDRFIGHLKTITKHKILVTSLCFKCGLYKQGLLHDLSKYSFVEFFAGVKYFDGSKSPITLEKQDKGYSLGWLHHKGRNKHHWEYWIDRLSKQRQLSVIEMPFNYVIECVLDKIAASKVYKKQDYTIEYPYEFFMNSYELHVMNQVTARQIAKLLSYLKENGEEKALKYYKELYHNYKKDNNFKI